MRWGVESICAVLTQHGCKIAPSTYYDARARRPTRHEIADEQWKPIVLDTWRKHRRVLGARKLWLRLRRDGHDIARCTVERLMRELGIAGVRRGKRKQPVDGALRETRPADLVDRRFSRFRTNQLWVADFTYVWTSSGWVYVAFVFDAHSRRITGWRAATSMTTPLVLDCLEMALWTRRREGVTGLSGLTHHTDAGSVYTSIAFTDRLVDEGIDPSVGSVGDSYDCQSVSAASREDEEVVAGAF
nr:IS3 family transposase [Microbacterium resistens]